MKKVLTLSALLMTVSIPAYTAYAAESYYIEIGREVPAASAKIEWEALAAKNSDLLGKLTYYSKTVIGPNGNPIGRIQAGPVADRSKAQKLCTKLFARNISCFVIEGLEKAPPTMSIGMAQAVVGAAEETGQTNWTATSEPKVLGHIGSAGIPSVAVAEAIPVPLSSASDREFNLSEEPAAPAAKPVPEVHYETKKIKPIVAEAPKAEVQELPKLLPLSPARVVKPVPVKPELPPAPVPAPLPEKAIEKAPSMVITKDLAPVEFATVDAGWLNVSVFDDERAANDFWQEVRGGNAELAAGLRVRILRPLSARSGSGVSLNIGPFPSEADAANFCKRAIEVKNDSLHCRFDASGAAVQTDIENLPAKYDHANQYEERRRQLEQQQHHVSKEKASSYLSDVSPIVHTPTGKVFWAQVVSADNKIEATQRWEDIKAANADVVDGVASRVTTPLSRHGKSNILFRHAPAPRANVP